MAIRDSNWAVAEVSLGTNDTYYVRFEDGAYAYSLQAACKQKFEELTEDGHDVTNVILSPGGFVSSWLIRY